MKDPPTSTVAPDGQHISHYEILDKLGEGGMGVVYRARDLKLDRMVALKFLPTGATANLKRFQQEAHALSKLNHPNIATIYDIDEDDRQRFIALEYLPGGTLRSRLKERLAKSEQFDASELIEIGKQVASALAHAHTHDVIHRDVKTENLMLSADGTVKITDFGLARLGGEHGMTKTGSTVGTAAYMSPEQVRGETIDHRSDIFSFGVVMFELATGRLPFEGDHEAAVLYSVLNKDAIGLETRTDLPPALTSLIQKCLAKNQNERFQSCDEILDELRMISGEQKIPATVPAKSSSRSILVWLLLVPVLGGLGFLGYVIVNRVFAGPAPLPPATIAVLYTENMTGDEHFGTFASGMTEEIINQLANVQGLQVLSRSDVEAYKGKPVDIRTVGEQLGVAYVLESSVRAEGNDIRVTCQAIQTSDRFHFWSQAYTKEMKGAFQVQTEIARLIAASLKTKFEQREIEYKLGLPEHSLNP